MYLKSHSCRAAGWGSRQAAELGTNSLSSSPSGLAQARKEVGSGEFTAGHPIPHHSTRGPTMATDTKQGGTQSSSFTAEDGQPSSEKAAF